jgi:hypothetical protein
VKVKVYLREFFGLVPSIFVQDLKEMKDLKKNCFACGVPCPISYSYERPRPRKPFSYWGGLGGLRRPLAASFLIRGEGLTLHGFLNV